MREGVRRPTVNISVVQVPASVVDVAEIETENLQEQHDLMITSRVRQLQSVEVQPDIADIIGRFLQGPLTGPGCGVGRGVAGVPDVGDVPGDCSPTAAGDEDTTSPKARGTGARGQTSQA